MKLTLKSSLLLGVALCVASSASAQLALQNFSAFVSPDTFFVGDWDGGGNAPRATFSQGSGAFVGSYRFEGGKNDDVSGAYYFFPGAPLDLSGYSLLQISARALAGNTAPTFTVSLFNSSESAVAVFSTASFTTTEFTTVTSILTFSPSFNLAAVDSFLITGGVLGGSASLNLAIDNLAVAAPRAVTAVPEPSTYGTFASLVLLALACRHQSRRSA